MEPRNDFDVVKLGKYQASAGVVLHARKRMNMKGEIAEHLIAHFAIVAAEQDGEDSAGRRAFKLQSPEDVVLRACEIADKFVDECEKRGWVIDIPAIDDIPSIAE